VTHRNFISVQKLFILVSALLVHSLDTDSIEKSLVKCGEPQAVSCHMMRASPYWPTFRTDSDKESTKGSNFSTDDLIQFWSYKQVSWLRNLEIHLRQCHRLQKAPKISFREALCYCPFFTGYLKAHIFDRSSSSTFL
jgi:hypothetical protein